MKKRKEPKEVQMHRHVGPNGEPSGMLHPLKAVHKNPVTALAHTKSIK